MRTLLRRLLEETDAIIGVFSIPKVEAEPNAIIHKKTEIVNEQLRNLVKEFSTSRMVYVPLAEALDCYSIPESQGGAFNEKDPPKLLWTPSKFIFNTMKVQFLHWVLRYSYEDLSRRYGLYTTSDTLHFNAHAGTFVSYFVEQFIHSFAPLVVPKEIAVKLPAVADRPLSLVELNGHVRKTSISGESKRVVDADEMNWEEAKSLDGGNSSAYFNPASSTQQDGMRNIDKHSKESPTTSSVEMTTFSRENEEKSQS